MCTVLQLYRFLVHKHPEAATINCHSGKARSPSGFQKITDALQRDLAAKARCGKGVQTALFPICVVGTLRAATRIGAEGQGRP